MPPSGSSCPTASAASNASSLPYRRRASSGAEKCTGYSNVTVVAGKPSEFKYKFSRMNAPKGVVVFKVTNLGMTVHDLKINGVKTRVLNTGKSQSIRVNFKKAGLCKVTADPVAAGRATLEWLLTPNQMQRMR